MSSQMLPAGQLPPSGAEVTVAAPSNSIARLPDLDAFSMFGDVQPGTIPLIVKKPDGAPEQLSVPLNSTVDDIKTTLQRQCSIDDENLTLSFGNSDLNPSSNLLDTNIVEAYEHAGSLLQMIQSAEHDPATKTAAMDSACAVVESISNGVTDMEALCEAAVNPDNFPIVGDAAPGNTTYNHLKETDSRKQRTADQLPHQFQVKNGADLVDEAIEAAAQATTPIALKQSLSRRLPNLFPSPNAGSSTVAQIPQQIPPSAEPQPSISSIRDRRRKARQAAVSSDILGDPNQMNSSAGMEIDDDIGISTYAKPLPTDLGKIEGDAETTGTAKDGGKTGGGTNVLLAHSGSTTWLDDVMKTWEVKTVRQSGVLEKSKDGQVVNQYLDNLEAEARQEAELEEEGIDPKDPSGEMTQALKLQPKTSSTSASPFTPGPSSLSTSSTSSTDSTTTNATANARNVVTGQSRSQSQPPMTASYPMAHPPAHSETLSILSNGFPSGGPATPSSSTTSGSSSIPIRRATRIAPAPTPGGTGNGFTSGIAMFQGCPPAPGTFSNAHAATVPGPKKRGRKRKNPQLTEEERALVRKEQNRESARLSRVRRKVIAAEYEDKLNGLVNENSMLRKQVEGLNNRLAYLQSILTVSVRHSSTPTPGAAPPANNAIPNSMPATHAATNPNVQ